jgi:hypothetical protein
MKYQMTCSLTSACDEDGGPRGRTRLSASQQSDTAEGQRSASPLFSKSISTVNQKDSSSFGEHDSFIVIPSFTQFYHEAFPDRKTAADW